MTKEQAIALARARLALQKQPQVTPEQPAEPPKPSPVLQQEPTPEMVDPDTMMMQADPSVSSDPAQAKAMVRNFLQGATFATADEMEAGLRSLFGDQSYAQNLDLIRNEMRTYAEENPKSALAQELAGALVSPAGILKTPQILAKATPMVRGAVRGGTGGALYGAGAAEGDVLDRLQQGLVGGGVGVIIGAPLEKAVGLLGNAKLNRQIKAQSRAPDLDRLKSIKDAAYEAVDQTNFAIGPGEAQQIFQRASKVADEAFYTPMPGTATAVDKAKKLLQDLTTKGMTLGNSEQVRRRLFKLAEDKTDGYIVRQMINEFDDVIEDSLAKGQIPQLQIAREANRKYKNSEAVSEAFAKVDVKVGKRTEGYRKVAQSLLNNKRQMKYFTDSEKQVLQAMADGTASQRLMNTLGRFDFSAKGLAGAINLYTLASAPWTALLFVGTGGAKYMADRKAIAAAQKLIGKAGGVEAVKKASQNPNIGTASVGGVTADQIRNVFFGEEEE